MKLREEKRVIKYDVKLQNKAAEEIFGSVDIQKHLDTPILVLDDKLCSLHYLTN